jgi:phospholipase C
VSQYLQPDLARLRQTIRHVVVLMLENRSFDNLLGWLYDGEQPPDGQHYEGLTAGLWNPLRNLDPDGVPFIEKVPIRKNGAPIERHGKQVATAVDFTLPRPDPGEGYKDTNHQLFEVYEVPVEYPPPPINTGFVQNYQNAMLYGTYSFGDPPGDPRTIMTCYTPAQTPVLSALARGFAVCDHYHCSVPSQTIPNRDFVHAATSTGHVNNHPVAACDAPTIFNQLQDAIDAGRTDLSWGVFGSNLLAGHGDAAGSFGGDHFSLTRLIMTRLHDARFDGNFGTLADFAGRCQRGELPSYAFLEPSYGGAGQNDQHPSSDIRAGEQLIADVYGWIKASPAFAETLLVITYDEHGGCYDHVAPPGGARNPDRDNRPGQDGFKFDRFGVRVPCVVVNPHIRRGLVARPAGRTPFDHTSIIKTVQQCFGLSGSLTERDRAAPDFSGLLGLDAPRTDDLPVVQPLPVEPAAAPSSSNDLHHLMGAILAAMTGAPAPEAGELVEFVQRSYTQVFGRRGS